MEKAGCNEPYVQLFRHPSYNDYPVIGVGFRQRLMHGELTGSMKVLIREGMLSQINQLAEENFNTESYLAGQYEGLVNQNLRSIDPNKEYRKVMVEDGMLLPKYRLPTEAEWEYAALALIGNTYEERVYERRIYPWEVIM
jgi:hypothetical protein